MGKVRKAPARAAAASAATSSAPPVGGAVRGAARAAATMSAAAAASAKAYESPAAPMQRRWMTLGHSLQGVASMGGEQLRAPATATAARAVRADAPREVWGNGVAGGRGGGGGGGAAAPAGGLPGAAARAATVAAASRGPSLPRQGPSSG